MPAAIFEPAAALPLAAYVEAVTRLYNNPNPSASPLALGSCAEIGYTGPSASRVTASWRGRGAPGDDGGLMGLVCAERCQCSFQVKINSEGILSLCRPISLLYGESL